MTPTHLLASLGCALVGILQAQTLDLRGRVVQANGTPVADATVDLKVRGTSVKTGADGSFAFSGNVGLGRAGNLPFAYRLETGFLSLAVPGPQDLRIEVVDGLGSLQGVLARRLESGPHRIALSEALPAPGAKAGLYFLRIRLDGETLTHPFFHSGNGAGRTVFAPAYRMAGMAAAKRAAAVDTLRVRKAGFQDIAKEIAGYAAGNLGDLTLAPAASTDGWVNLFNGKDLTGWVPLIYKSKVGDNYMDTFRADSVNKVIRVAYDKYPNQNFDNRLGNLYYNKRLTNYRVRVTYRFNEPQAKNPVSWGRNNSGLMVFGIDPYQIDGSPQFLPSIEIQLLGSPSSGTSTPSYCDIGGMVMTQFTGKCGNNGSGIPLHPANQWATIQADVQATGVTKVYLLPDTTKPAFTMSGPKYQNQAVTSGFIALQSESQPVEFKDILLKELP